MSDLGIGVTSVLLHPGIARPKTLPLSAHPY